MIVVDVNVVAYLLIEGERTSLAREVWRLDPDWRVPDLWRHEFLNVLATLARSKILDFETAAWTWRQALDLLRPGETEIEMSEALTLAMQTRISAYDAQYITLAQQLGVPLVTEDRQLLKTFSGLSLAMSELLELSAE